MQEVFDRESSFASRGSDQGDVTSISIYESVAGLLEERALMRELWAKRETDHAFRDMSVEDRPLPLPCKYGVVVSVEEKVTVTTNSNEQLQLGVSPMPGTPEELRKLAADLRAMGRAYVSGTSSDLPELMLMSEPAEAKNDNNHEHAKADDWSGWNDLDFGLEMQSPWARALLEGRKTIETRAYDLPPALLGKRIAVIETPKGKQAGVSAMGNHVDFERSDEAKIVGWCKFSSVKKYTNSRDFERDEKAHLVHNASGYGWNVGTTKAIYGWVVGECGVENHSSCKSATRRLRSLYQLIPRGSCDNDCKLPGTASRKRQQGMAKKQSDSGCKKKKRRF